MAHTAAYRVLQALCQALSDADAIRAVFAAHGGNIVRPYVVCSMAQNMLPTVLLEIRHCAADESNLQLCCCCLL